MAGIQEALSGRLRLSFTPAPRTSLLLLRLNDSALRALQDCQRIQARPVIAFQGNRGYLRLPGPGCSCLFSFIVSQCGADGPRGGLDLVRHRLGRSGPGLLRCLGPLRERITICSAIDSVPVSSLLQEHHQGEGSRETRSQQGSGLNTGPQPQLEVEVLDPLENSQEAQPIPGSSRDHLAQWVVRDLSPHPIKGLDQRPTSSSSQRHLIKKRHTPPDTPEPEDKRLRGPGSPQELPKHDSQEEGEEWEKEDLSETPTQEHSSSAQAGPESMLPGETPDYFLQYGAIRSADQCRVYEQDFEADYAEYRALHARIGAVSRRFMQLGIEIKRVQQGTPEHKVLEDKIVQEYRKFRKRCPGYKEERQRCEYLHQKLSHIKSLILEFEKNSDS